MPCYHREHSISSPLPLPIDRCDPPKKTKNKTKNHETKKTKTEIQTPNDGHNYLTKQTPITVFQISLCEHQTSRQVLPAHSIAFIVLSLIIQTN